MRQAGVLRERTDDKGGRVHVAEGLPGQGTRPRVVSVDAFRGLTMVLMILANDLSTVHGLPRWTYHMPTEVNAMSYVDVVFPAFLFAVGLSMPLAVRQRLRRDPSMAAMWGHALRRTAALLVLGLILANADLCDPGRMYGIRGSLWALVGLTGGLLVWGRFGGVSKDGSGRRRVKQAIGGLLLLACFALFRRSLPGGQAGWIAFEYPEILGLIGLTYLGACLLYLPFRRIRWAPLGWMAALLAIDVGCMARVISVAHLSIYVWPLDNGSMEIVTMAGIVASTIFLDAELGWTVRRRVVTGLAFALTVFTAGWALVPFGISKNRGTPTWSLWSAAACLVVFCGLYWVCDVRGWRRWTVPFQAPGDNTLLTYLLPDVYGFVASLFGFSAFLLQWNHGWPGVVRAVLFTLAMLALSTALTRARVRMQV